MERPDHEIPAHAFTPAEVLVFSEFESRIVASRNEVVSTVVETQLGITSGDERAAARKAIDEYVAGVSMAADSFLGTVYDNLDDIPCADDPQSISFRNEHFISKGVDAVTDAVEADVQLLHAGVTETRAERSHFQTAFEKGRAMKYSKFIGRIVVNGPGAAAAYAGNEVINGQVDNKFIVGSILVGVFAGVRFGAPIALKSAAQVVLGKRVEKVLRPVSTEVSGKLKAANKLRRKHGRDKLSLDEKVARIRKLETAEKVDNLHDELGSEVRDWLLETTGSAVPTREQAVAIIREALTEHLCYEYGIDYEPTEYTDEEDM
jgi:hypothetical protein